MNSVFNVDKINQSFIDLNLDPPRQHTSLQEKVAEIAQAVNLGDEGIIVKPARSIFERLSDNRKDAEEQQRTENPKRFTVDRYPAPDRMVEGVDIKAESFFAREVGVAYSQGWRDEMEDEEIAIQASFEIPGYGISGFKLFGVFDGHCGKEASLFVKQRIKHYLIEALQKNNSEGLSDEGIFIALKQCFTTLDEDLRSKIAGTTATVAVLIQDKIWVANTGDSRTVLVKEDGQTLQASEDAKPCMEKYAQKIIKLGGFVVFHCGELRVNGKLSVARAIGDKDIQGTHADGSPGKCCVSPKPKITCFPLDEFKGGYLVLACDGLYDVASTNEVGKAIHEMAEWGKTCKEMSKKLVYHAIDKGSEDNVSVMVVGL